MFLAAIPSGGGRRAANHKVCSPPMLSYVHGPTFGDSVRWRAMNDEDESCRSNTLCRRNVRDAKRGSQYDRAGNRRDGGYQHRLIYCYFKGKSDIIEALVNQVVQRLQQKMKADSVLEGDSARLTLFAGPWSTI